MRGETAARPVPAAQEAPACLASLGGSGRWDFGPLHIEARDEVDPGTVDRFWLLYEAAFGPLRPLAAARQFLRREEFGEELLDPRVTKYLASEGGQPVGMATMTRDLRSVPWISPEFYAARYPEQWERGAVFYLGFILVDPALRASRVFHRLNQVVTDIAAGARGILAYDICAYNNASFRLADRIETFVSRRLPSRYSVVDTQTYYAIDFAPSPGS